MKRDILLFIGVIMFLVGGLIQNAYSFPSAIIAADQTYAGHEYRVVVDKGIHDWRIANAQATNGWYLATITSQQEQNFIESLIKNAQEYYQNHRYSEGIEGLWLGGFFKNNSWHWVTGESWSYTNWGPSQPCGGDYLAIAAEECGGGCCGGCCSGHCGRCCPKLELGQWYTPISCGCSCGCSCCKMSGYIEERPATVPEPMTIILLGSGILGIWGYRKKSCQS